MGRGMKRRTTGKKSKERRNGWRNMAEKWEMEKGSGSGDEEKRK